MTKHNNIESTLDIDNLITKTIKINITSYTNSTITKTSTTFTTTTKMKKSPLTPSTIPPPSINRQHSYNTNADNNANSSPLGQRSTDARNILSRVASRAASPGYSNSSPNSSPMNTPTPESPSASTFDRRRSWEDCVHQRDGYISFPDFDQMYSGGSGR